MQNQKKLILIKLSFTLVFFLGVFACYWGAINNMLWFGPTVVALIAVLRLTLSSEKRSDIKIILLVSGLGVLIETILIFTGVYTPDSSRVILLPWPLLPEWILALWVNFALKVKDLLGLFKEKLYLSSLVGFIFGILIFRNANARGLLELNLGNLSLLLIAILWALGLTIMIYYALAIKE